MAQEQEQEQASAQPSLREQVLAHLRETVGEWEIVDYRQLRRRVMSPSYLYCPITSLCAARTGVDYPIDEYAQACRLLGYADVKAWCAIVDAADFPRWELELRAELLEAAGLPPEEPEPAGCSPCLS